MNALTLLKQDHGNVEALFKRYEALDANDVEDKREVVDKIIEQLSVHAAIEEQVFYPAVRQAEAEAVELALEALEEHHLVKLSLWELEKLQPTSERFDAKVAVLIENVRRHVAEEEGELFDHVRKSIPATRLDELGEAMQEAKATAPTRPHPFQPDTPPLNGVLAVPVAVLDRAFTLGKQTLERAMSRRS